MGRADRARQDAEVGRDWARIGRMILEDGAAGERQARRILHENHEREELSPRVAEGVVLFAKMIAAVPDPGSFYRRAIKALHGPVRGARS